MSEYYIGGIQQVGVGVPDLNHGWQWYRSKLGFGLPIFRDRGMATLMQRYTGGKVEEREATLAINLVGGGGLEIWQYINRIPRRPGPSIPGSPGIYGVRLKCASISQAYDYAQRTLQCSTLFTLPNGQLAFALCDHLNNLYLVIEQTDMLQRRAHPIGGVCGAIIGCSNIERALPIYSGLLGYDRVIYDHCAPLSYIEHLQIDPSSVTKFVTTSRHSMRQLLLERSDDSPSPLRPLYGNSHIELWELQDDKRPPHLFAGRQWGDIGFIHLCFEIKGLEAFRQRAQKERVAFTVDSGGTFQMGEAGGRFAYIEDPDGTLIELVETHRISLSKHFGIGINLSRRKSQPLPRIFFWLLGLARRRGKRSN